MQKRQSLNPLKTKITKKSIRSIRDELEETNESRKLESYFD